MVDREYRVLEWREPRFVGGRGQPRGNRAWQAVMAELRSRPCVCGVIAKDVPVSKTDYFKRQFAAEGFEFAARHVVKGRAGEIFCRYVIS